ncbi:hypothetical protein GJ744_008311 [Endocarpon pusillum]|uniref:Uncharacterized protein n=1 Tax=Endocarpon pusillum TaxID=364733 RepID=A0A8H7AJ37_9EURO|nr:hypothetical protein GJ744_008311 [Endocarpon pusillum]
MRCEGDQVRYGPDRLIFNTVTALRDVHSFGNNVQKCKGYQAMTHRVPNTITQRNKTLHVKQRRVLSQGFSDRAMRHYEEVIAAHVNEFCHHLTDEGVQSIQLQGGLAKNKWYSPTDMAQWCESGVVRFQAWVTLQLVEL